MKFALAVVRLVYCVVMLFVRQSEANRLASEEENRLGRLTSEKRKMLFKTDKLQREQLTLEIESTYTVKIECIKLTSILF